MVGIRAPLWSSPASSFCSRTQRTELWEARKLPEWNTAPPVGMEILLSVRCLVLKK